MDILTTPLPLLHCPATRPAALYPGTSAHLPNYATINGTWAKTDYAGNAGIATAGTPDGNSTVNGCVVRTGTIRLNMTSGIPDGTTFTLMLGEKRMCLDDLSATVASSPPYDNEPCYVVGFASNADSDVMRIAGFGGNPPTTIMVPAPHSDPPLDAQTGWQFGAHHGGGMNSVFADGSVRMVRFGATPAIFLQACVRNDASPYSMDDL
jgi:prepilin-type processing-associated H-X9-DG protein